MSRKLSEQDREAFLAALGIALRGHREAAGLSQEELGYRAGLHRTYMSDLERGQRNPTMTTLLTLCRTLDVRLSDIMAAAEETTADMGSS